MPTGRNNFAGRNDELKPRELMERAACPSMMSDEALLAILLKTGAPGLDVIELSHRLLASFGSLKNLVSADWRGIEEGIRQHNKLYPNQAIRGIGHVKCLELAAAFEMGRRWARLSPEEIKGIKVETAEDAFRVFKAVVNPVNVQENVYVLMLDAKCHPICEPICVVRGESASVAVEPKEIFREAVRWGAHAVIVAHNHPSGNVNPSQEDIDLTRRILAVAEVVSVPLLDHLVLGEQMSARASFTSIRDKRPDVFEERNEL